VKKITATIITLNEAENIRDCIASVLPVCDEIIVVDSGSEDETVAIAESMGARVFHQSYLGDGPQKDFGVQFARNDWILSIDADERLEDDAVRAIDGLELENTDADAFAFRRRNYVGRHWIRAAGFYPDEVVRLYNRQKCRYLSKKKHSRVEARKIKHLSAHIQHLTYRDYAHWIERINQLSSRDAWAMYEDGRCVRPLTPFFRSIWAMFRKLILKGGIFQGKDGFTVAITTAFHVYFKYLKFLELQEKQHEINSQEESD